VTRLATPQRSERGRMRSETAAGWILLEILAALVLFSVLIGPLVTGLISGVDRAATIRAETESVSSDDASHPAAGMNTTSAAWEWGPRVVTAVWRPGPALEARVAMSFGSTDGQWLVGIWIDGWFRGEESPDDTGILTLKAGRLAESCGHELVLRVREKDAAWGPPWRLVVPDAYGALASTSPVAKKGAVLHAAETEADTVAHVPGRANPQIETSSIAVDMVLDSLAFPLFLTPGGLGNSDLLVGGERQSWRMENDRALDLYF